MYDNYYTKQAGGGMMPVFSGRRYQRGHGVGQMLGNLFGKYIVPFAKNLGKQALGNVLHSGAEIASDVVAGKKFKDSLKTHSLEAINKTLLGALNQSSNASPSVGQQSRATPSESVKKRKKKHNINQKSKRRRRRADIFG